MFGALRRACHLDAQEIVSLVNRAFEIEHFFRDGDRVDLEEARTLLNKGTFLLFSDTLGLAGCVYVQIRGQRGYVGLLSVDPARQRFGIGSRLMEYAEEFCRSAGCGALDLRIISVRAELLSYYQKLGFIEAGAEAAPMVKTRSQRVHFILMSKKIAPQLTS
jgi:GNAT superfamily N-acetyltransferase